MTQYLLIWPRMYICMIETYLLWRVQSARHPGVTHGTSPVLLRLTVFGPHLAHLFTHSHVTLQKDVVVVFGTQTGHTSVSAHTNTQKNFQAFQSNAGIYSALMKKWNIRELIKKGLFKEGKSERSFRMVKMTFNFTIISTAYNFDLNEPDTFPLYCK